MTERDADRTRDELYVPTPEELERGIEPGARERKPASREEARKRRRLDWARRLFRLGRGVGQERSEVPAPTPPPAIPDPGPPAHSTKPEPESSTEGDTPPVSHSSPAVPQKSQEPRIRSQRTTTPQPVESAGTSPSAPATASKQRLRRVVIPERPRQPVEIPPPSPVPEWIVERAQQKGHRLGRFKVDTRGQSLAAEQDRRYVSECVECNLKAYAINAAPGGWTIRDAGTWRPQGRAFEEHCTQ